MIVIEFFFKKDIINHVIYIISLIAYVIPS